MRRLARLLFLLALTGLLLTAHDALESTALLRLHPGALELEVTLARQTALAFATGQPTTERFEPEDFAAHRDTLLRAAPRLFDLMAGGALLALEHAEVVLTVKSDIEFRLRYPRPNTGPVELICRHVAQLGPGYGSVLSFDYFPVGAIAPPARLLMADDLRHQVDLPGGTAAALADPPVFRPFLRLGFQHILIGYDHLLFLAGLLLLCPRVGPMLAIITSFTVAHSLTLAIAAFGWFTLPGALVEPLIAASIVYVAAENLLRRHSPTAHRWQLTLLFGLIHGFGFAGVLAESGLAAGTGGMALPLFAFNLGVELGQLAVAALLLPLLLALRRYPLFVQRGLPALSALVGLAGVVWLVQRTLLT